MTEHITKLFFSCAIGLIIGIERAIQKENKHVGPGTCSIVCLSATLLTIVSVNGFNGDADTSRIVANIITAIGFLGGGVIVKKSRDNEDEIIGLTTGALLFCLAGLGIATALGYYLLVIVVLILVEFSIFVSKRLKAFLSKRQNSRYLE